MNKPPFESKFLHPRFWLTWLGLGLWRAILILPFPILLWLGRLLGRLMYRVGHERRAIAECNLELCFPQMTATERTTLVKENFSSYGMAFFEVGMAWWWSDKRFFRLIQIEGVEHLMQLQQKGKGALLMAIHFTTLEVGASALSDRFSIDGMYRPHKNAVYDYVQARGRLSRSTGDSVVYPRKDVRGMFRALRQGRIIWYAPDQDYGPKQSVFASFFGVPAASVTATARFARMGDAAVVPFTQIRLPGSQGYRVTVHPPLENFPAGDDVADAETINRYVESYISECPQQYMWVHRRFKTRPPGAEPVYPAKVKKRKKNRL
ncbi:MAG: LpxL/LpxP family Kdo(2)-lipid IV(A) lauroyl/palmitoleoyl acyltransferase [Porticoccaceae bacterium]|nr:LpxL/LpxP family Kdo(2)-lipid IV(A) lauroyl/palmitoleoyl acyltransferase [Pseudomonadales bacterium]MCP5171854.1 LpxL/LpxP family Kdo(2)-lipid IV(A) lauroyl/palmitoleoyl acyltransferase [Pseudomonadales bacterium]